MNIYICRQVLSDLIFVRSRVRDRRSMCSALHLHKRAKEELESCGASYTLCTGVQITSAFPGSIGDHECWRERRAARRDHTWAVKSRGRTKVPPWITLQRERKQKRYGLMRRTTLARPERIS
jgi:hypothetical protein